MHQTLRKKGSNSDVVRMRTILYITNDHIRKWRHGDAGTSMDEIMNHPHLTSIFVVVVVAATTTAAAAAAAC